MRILLEARNLSAKLNNVLILDNINFSVEEGQHWAIIGDSGSGKTSLANALVGRLFHSGEVILAPGQSIQLLEQQHRFKTLSNTSNFYYQQRYQSQDAEDSLTIEQELAEELASQLKETQKWLGLLQLNDKLKEPLIQLSNGENKRLQLAKALLHQPNILVMDNPFVGLDVAGRALLHSLINELASKGIHLILVTSKNEIPACVTRVLNLEKGKQVYTGPRNEMVLTNAKDIDQLIEEKDLAALPKPDFPNFNVAIKMVNVRIQYGEKNVKKVTI